HRRATWGAPASRTDRKCSSLAWAPCWARVGVGARRAPRNSMGGWEAGRGRPRAARMPDSNVSATTCGAYEWCARADSNCRPPRRKPDQCQIRRHGPDLFRLTNPAPRHNYGHFAASIFTELTVNVAFSCVDEPIVELNASLSFNFVSLVMPMTSTLWPTCALRRPPMRSNDGLFSKETSCPEPAFSPVPAVDGMSSP